MAKSKKKEAATSALLLASEERGRSPRAAMCVRKEEELEAKVAKSEEKEAEAYAKLSTSSDKLIASDKEVRSLQAREAAVQAREDEALELMASFETFKIGPGSFRSFFRWRDLMEQVTDLRKQVTDLRG